jgi:hypothetical protein
MAPVEVTSILFKDFVNDGKVPEDNFVVNKEHSIDPDSDLKDGQIFLRLLYLSVDPYMRTRMRKMEVMIACWAADLIRAVARTEAVQLQLQSGTVHATPGPDTRQHALSCTCCIWCIHISWFNYFAALCVQFQDC